MLQKPGDGAGHGADDVDIRYGEYRSSVLAHIRECHPDLDAEDVVQETLERFLRTNCRVRPNQSVSSVLFGIADDVADEIRSHQRSEREALPQLLEPSGAESAEVRALLRRQRAVLADALNLLSPFDKQVLILRHCWELKEGAIAERLHINYAAARQRVSRAERRFKENLTRLGFVLVVLSCPIAVARRLWKSSIGGPATVSAAACALGVGAALFMPHGQPGTEMIGVQPQNPGLSSSGHPGHSQGSPKPVRAGPTAPTASKAPTTPRAPESPASPEKALPVQSHVEVSPGTGPGRKEAHWLHIDTPVGPITVEGERFANGPASVDPACTETVCSQAEEVTTDDVNSKQPPP